MAQQFYGTGRWKTLLFGYAWCQVRPALINNRPHFGQNSRDTVPAFRSN